MKTRDENENENENEIFFVIRAVSAPYLHPIFQVSENEICFEQGSCESARAKKGGAKTSKYLLPKTLIKPSITVGFSDTMVTTLSGTYCKNFYR
jgi:hypothetical protein